MLEAGATAPAVTFKSLTGAAVHRPAGPVVLAFFKVSCPTCQMAFPYLERLAHGALRFLAVSQDNVDATQRFKQNLSVTFETVMDPSADGYAASNAFGLTNVPSIFLIEPDGRISLASMGFNKHDFEILGERAGLTPFGPGDQVPQWKPG